MMEAAIGISVFLNDADSYDKAMKKYMGRVPAYIYLKSDGDLPKVAPGLLMLFLFQRSVLTPDFRQRSLGQRDCRLLARTEQIRGWHMSGDLS